VVNLDALTYSASLDNVASVSTSPGYAFEHADICDATAVASAFERHQPDAIMHLAAESHNDRAIDGPIDFVRTNVLGTAVLLEAARLYWSALPLGRREAFRFHHVSTDEVFGALGENGAFSETTPYDPSSPYSASKAGADHLVRAWGRTYGLPVVITNCANNYGPFQFPEKLVPTVVVRALEGKTIPVYGDGRQVRDWLYVGDHCTAIRRVLEAGTPGEVYNIGGSSEMANIDVVHLLCAILDELQPRTDGRSYREQITFVKDRPGHDRRYAIDARKITTALGWRPAETFASGIRRTVRWYLDHQDWVANVTSGSYRDWVAKHYAS
jgi:dTDP-glucose 4,6-dehydratase